MKQWVKTERRFIDKNCRNRNCQSLRHDKAHPYLTGTSETIFAHSYSLSHLVPFLSVLGRRCDLHHGMKKMRLEKVSSPH